MTKRRKKINNKHIRPSKYVCKCCDSNKLIKIHEFNEDGIDYIEFLCNICHCNTVIERKR